MKKLQIFFLLSIFLPLFYVNAEKKSSIQKYELSSEIKNIRIQMQHVHIRLLHSNSKKKELKIKYKGSLEVDEDDATFVISEKSFPNEKQAWKIKNTEKKMMTIWVPKIPVKVAVFSGRVEVDELKKVKLSVFMPGKGTVQIKNTAGTVQIFQGGYINIHSYKGELTVQAENSRIHLQSCKGTINLSGFKGRVEVNKSEGRLIVRSFKSPLILNHFTGHLDFRQEKGGVYLKPVIGSVLGYSKQGEIRGAIQPNQVNIETDTGKIHLDFPYSRAWLTAETWEGRIFTPRYFNRVKTGGMERTRGRLKGSKIKGNISLKSHSGSIKVYQSVH